MGSARIVRQAIAWAVVAMACGAMLVWYRMVEMEGAAAIIGSSIILQALLMVSGPLLVFAVGALLGLGAVRVARLAWGRVARTILKVIGTIPLAMLLLNLVVLTAPDMAPALSMVIAVTWYVAMVVPILYAVFGACFSLGFASARRSACSD